MAQEKTTTMADGTVSKVTALPEGCTLALFDSSGGVTKIDAQKFMELVRGSVQIGGRNLLKGQSKDWWQVKLGPFASYVINKKTYEDLDIKAGDAVTFSLDIKNTTQKKVGISFEPYNSDSDRGRVNSEAVLPGEEKRISVSMIVPNGFSIMNLRIVNLSMEIADTQSLTVRRAKLERGNVATDWSPAPEDIIGGG